MTNYEKVSAMFGIGIAEDLQAEGLITSDTPLTNVMLARTPTHYKLTWLEPWRRNDHRQERIYRVRGAAINGLKEASRSFNRTSTEATLTGIVLVDVEEITLP